jgi:hypothetical protein
MNFGALPTDQNKEVKSWTDHGVKTPRPDLIRDYVVVDFS